MWPRFCQLPPKLTVTSSDTPSVTPWAARTAEALRWRTSSVASVLVLIIRSSFAWKVLRCKTLVPSRAPRSYMAVWPNPTWLKNATKMSLMANGFIADVSVATRGDEYSDEKSTPQDAQLRVSSSVNPHLFASLVSSRRHSVSWHRGHWTTANSLFSCSMSTNAHCVPRSGKDKKDKSIKQFKSCNVRLFFQLIISMA